MHPGSSPFLENNVRHNRSQTQNNISHQTRSATPSVKHANSEKTTLSSSKREITFFFVTMLKILKVASFIPK